MSRKTRSYSDEYKAEALELIKKIGVSKTAKDLNVAPSLLYTWKAKKEAFSPSPKLNLEESEKENRRLKKELAHANKINEVLKKSLGIFVKDQI